MEPPNRGLSVRQLSVIFFGVVGLCAIFFALGYLTGANRRPSPAGPVVEQVPPPSDIPAPINQPLDAPEGTASPGAHAPKSASATIIEQNLPATGSERRPAAAASIPRLAGSQHERGVVVQVAALRTESDAQSLVHVLKSRGYHALMVTPQEAGDSLYRVQVGPFSSRSKAVRSVQKLSSQGFRPFIKE